MSAWKALYVIPLVGISLAATAETKVDYRYEDLQPEAVADTLKARVVKVHDTIDHKDSENWHKVSSGEPSSFRKKNLHEGKIITDPENRTLTVIYYDNNEKECQVQFTGIDLNQDIYIHNGAIVTKGMADKAAEDPEAVMMTSYLKDGKKVRAFVTPSGTYMTGKVQISDLTINTVEVNRSNSVIILNGERMPEGFDLNTIDPKTIASMEVLKTEKALQEYGTDKGVIVITTDPSKADEKKPVPDIYIDGKKATSEEIAALPANPRGSIASDGTVWITTEDEPEEKPLNSAPSFNGGSSMEFQKWVLDNIRFPEGVSAEGRVSVSFTISETGKVTDVKVLRGADQMLNDEAVRVISSSPDWTPALKDGKPIAIQMLIPVEFKK